MHSFGLRITGPLAFVLGIALTGAPPSPAAADGVIATIAVGATPYGIAVTPDGSQVYVSNSTAGSVSVIDTSTRTVTKTIRANVGAIPVGIAVEPTGSTAYVGNFTQGTITAIDTVTGTTSAHDIRAATTHQCQWILNLKVSFDGSKLFLACQDDVRVQMLDLPGLATGRLLAETGNNSFPSDLAVTSDDSSLVVPVNGPDDGINANSALFIDVVTAPITNTYLKPVTAGPFSVAISPTSGLAYLAGQTSGDLSVVNPATRARVGSDIPVGGALSDIVIAPDGRAAFVSVVDRDEVKVVDLEAGVVTNTVSVGDGPQSIALSPDGRTLYTANRNSNTVSVVALPALTPGPVTTVVGRAGNGEVTVSWMAPISDGGSSITGYTVTSTPGGMTCSAVTTQCSVGGLTNGTAYTFTVTAANAVGTSAPSLPSASLTPRAPSPTPDPAPAPAPQPAPPPAAMPTPEPTVEAEPWWADAVERMRSLTPTQVRRLTAAQLAAFPPQAFAILTPAQVNAIRPRQVSQLDALQIQAIAPRSLRALRPDTLARLRVTQIRSITPVQRLQLRTAQLRKLGPTKRRILSGVLSPVEVNGNDTRRLGRYPHTVEP